MTWHGKWDEVGHFNSKYLFDSILVFSFGFPLKAFYWGMGSWGLMNMA